MRRRYRRHRGSGAWIYGTALFLLLVGGIVGAERPDEAQERHQELCAPLTWRAGMDAEGWDLLIDQGYDERGDRLYPPGCESAR